MCRFSHWSVSDNGDASFLSAQDKNVYNKFKVKKWGRKRMSARNKERNLDTKVTIRIDSETKEILSQIKNRNGLSYSEIIRLSIWDNLKKIKVVKISNEKKIDELSQKLIEMINELKNVRKEIVVIGNNLNQIARHLNTREKSELELKEVALNVKRFNAVMNKITEWGSERWRLLKSIIAVTDKRQ